MHARHGRGYRPPPHGQRNVAAPVSGAWIAFHFHAYFHCLSRHGFDRHFRVSRRFPRRPPRLTLFQNVSPFYFITFNTHRRQPVLANQPVHHAFVQYCRRAESEHSIAVGRYVIMPDHVHLFVCLPEQGIRLSRWVGQLKRAIGDAVIDPVQWQEGFFDHILRSAESYSQKWDYVRRNPARAGLCDNADDWRWQGEIVRVEF